ncbi:MAG: type II toxin-antitoxin system VapB family antitoxin [Rhizobiaceae bacterium]|nr:type II toxin-antitoxin system VapB family antitoxin [Rhizobiaceae bacterium]
MVRQLARKRGVGITTAIRQAVGEALEGEGKQASLWDRTADLRARYASGGQEISTDKAFFDSLSDED